MLGGRERVRDCLWIEVVACSVSLTSIKDFDEMNKARNEGLLKR